MAAGVARAREFGVSYELADAAFWPRLRHPPHRHLRAFGLHRFAAGGAHLELSRVRTSRGRSAPQCAAGLRRVHRGLGRARPDWARTGDRGRDEVINSDYEYVARTQPDDPVIGLLDPREVMDTDSPGGRFARAVFLDTLRYCCEVAPRSQSTSRLSTTASPSASAGRRAFSRLPTPSASAGLPPLTVRSRQR